MIQDGTSRIVGVEAGCGLDVVRWPRGFALKNVRRLRIFAAKMLRKQGGYVEVRQLGVVGDAVISVSSLVFSKLC